ncbi:MAG: DNA polymerase III subunit gamma/tau [Gammaproteobacteria bacterium]|nr:DNA polymerase III subunit gamma/tau [Gammaproteobacteria bacterium]
MSYQVLARKWRPRNFSDMVGQTHVLKALTNALDTDRLHHAYLFSGTRGVGKTTLARILARCLNCEKGVSSTPCGECSACVGIDEGRFVDLIEVDAASRARVEETRDLMDNVQYAPSMGRYKVYLIDEVHMFSNHSFNALLKTLEEPPPHVKFLLATTEPKKLPITILSRCLQFNLKHLTKEQIASQLSSILEKENIENDQESTRLLALAADGSMRDALSLLDQAISYGNGVLAEDQVREMLGSIDSAELSGLVEALIENDGEALLQKVAKMAEHSPDYDAILSELLSRLQAIALSQVLNNGDQSVDSELAGRISREDVQLYYQIALNGRRDLNMAPDPRIGFEMTLIRMLAFRPLTAAGGDTPLAGSRSIVSPKPEKVETSPAATSEVEDNPKHVLAIEDQVPVTEKETVPVPEQDNKAMSGEWQKIIDEMALAGMLKEFAAHCSLKEHTDSLVHLILSPAQEHLLKTTQKQRLQDAIKTRFGDQLKLLITVEDTSDETPAEKRLRVEKETQEAARQSILSDSNVKKLEEMFDATLDKESIRPV